MESFRFETNQAGVPAGVLHYARPIPDMTERDLLLMLTGLQSAAAGILMELRRRDSEREQFKRGYAEALERFAEAPEMDV